MMKTKGALSVAMLLWVAAACAVDCGSCMPASMDIAFNQSNELQRVLVGTAEFATGGGDLWTAKFAAGDVWTNLATVAAHADNI